MDKKVLIISIDGVRSDAVKVCGNPFITKLESISAYTYNGSSVYPSVTFPCHFSMTHSVTPERHGILTNTYVPQVRPVDGIFEKAKSYGLTTAMFYNWDELRDIALPGSMKIATYLHHSLMDSTDTYLTNECAKTLTTLKPQLAMLYMGETDAAGHKYGWMSKEYLDKINIAYKNVEKIVTEFQNEYEIIILTDHGGHERSHGSDMKEDMTIPFYFVGEVFNKGEIVNRNVSLLDVAPTVAKILNISPDSEWEGNSII